MAGDAKNLIRHSYVSTACQHFKHEECRKSCKFCDEMCLCPCHLLVNARDAKEAK